MVKTPNEMDKKHKELEDKLNKEQGVTFRPKINNKTNLAFMYMSPDQYEKIK